MRLNSDRAFSVVIATVALFAYLRPQTSPPQDGVLRASKIELADASGVVRFQVEVSESGALMQMRGPGSDAPWSVICGVSDVLSPSITFKDFKFGGSGANAYLGVEGMPGAPILTLSDGGGRVRFRAQGPPKDSQRVTLEVRTAKDEAVLSIK